MAKTSLPSSTASWAVISEPDCSVASTTRVPTQSPEMMRLRRGKLAAKGGVPFEEALKKLEGVVDAMEADDLPLETLLAKYEEGARLVKICQEKLAEAEVKIQQLEKNAAGELKLKPLDLAGE